MNDLEMNSIVEGMFMYLREKTEVPLDAIAILGMTLLMLFDRATDGTIPITQFAEDFRASLLESYRAQSAKGTESIQ